MSGIFLIIQLVTTEHTSELYNTTKEKQSYIRSFSTACRTHKSVHTR